MLSRRVAAAALGPMLLVGVLFAQATEARSLLKPETFTETAPETYKVKFETSKGDFVVQVTREWAPLGADRFYSLVKNGFYDEIRFFRAVPGFVVQFGINGDPAVSRAWQTAKIDDDPVVKSNGRGTITFATSGKNSRTTQVFINYGNNKNLDGLGFAAFGVVVEGMEDVVDKLYQGYAEQVTKKQFQIVQQGNAYLNEAYPNLDYIKKATILGN